MTSERREISIALVVAIVLVAVTALALALFSVFNYRHEEARQMEQLRAETEIAVEQLAVSLALPVWNFDRAQIDKVIESGMQSRDIAAIYLQLADVDKSIHARGRDRKWQVIPIRAEPPKEGLLAANRSVLANGEVVGTVNVLATPRFTRMELGDRLNQWMLDIIGIDLLLIVCLFLLLWRFVLYPVRMLEKQAAAVSAGGSGGEAPRPSAFFGELETLRESLAQMIHLLNARHAAVREMAARIMQLQDEERRKMGRDLHDSTGQTLAALEINLGILSRVSKSNADARTLELIAQCIELADKCSSEIRTASYLLHPPLLDEMGLSSALRWYADGFSKRSNIQVKLELPEAGQRLPDEVELSLFRVVQEALTNIHRHSGSATASIVLKITAQEIVLEIADGGCGISSDELRNFHEGGSSLGVGLAGMRQRIQQLGGDLRIQSSKAGSIVKVRAPGLSLGAPRVAGN